MSNCTLISMALLALLLSLGCVWGALPVVDPSDSTAEIDRKPTKTIEPTTAPVLEPKEVAEAFLKALHEKDFETAVAMYSDFSLRINSLDRAEQQKEWEKLDFEGWHLTEYRILNVVEVRNDTLLVEYLAKAGYENVETVETHLPLHLENGEWRVGAGGIVDAAEVDAAPQTVNGVRARPYKIVRRVDTTIVLVEIKNDSDRVVHWGWGRDVLTTVHFEDDAPSMWGAGQLQAGQEYPIVWARADGWRKSYPTRLTLSSFYLADEANPDLYARDVKSWSYEFNLYFELETPSGEQESP